MLTHDQLEELERNLLDEKQWKDSIVQPLASSYAEFSVATATAEQRQGYVDILKNKFNIDAAIQPSTTITSGNTVDVLRVEGDNFLNLHAAQHLADPQNWQDETVTQGQTTEPARDLDMSNMPPAQIQYCLSLMQKLGIPATVINAGDKLRIVGAPSIADLEAKIATLGANVTPGAHQSQTSNLRFRPEHIRWMVTNLDPHYEKEQINPNNPHDGYRYSDKNDKTKHLFTVKPYIVNMHKDLHNNDAALRDSIKTSVMLFDGNIKLNKGTVESRAKFEATLRDMLQKGELFTLDAQNQKTPLTQIIYNGRTIDLTAPPTPGAGRRPSNGATPPPP